MSNMAIRGVKRVKLEDFNRPEYYWFQVVDIAGNPEDEPSIVLIYHEEGRLWVLDLFTQEAITLSNYDEKRVRFQKVRKYTQTGITRKRG